MVNVFARSMKLSEIFTVPAALEAENFKLVVKESNAQTIAFAIMSGERFRLIKGGKHVNMIKKLRCLLSTIPDELRNNLIKSVDSDVN